MPIIANNKYYVIKANGKYYDIYNPFKTFTFTIVPTPSDATVTLTAQGYSQVGNSITVRRGTTVSWSVSKTDYITQSGSQTVNADETKNIILESSFIPETIRFDYTGAVQIWTVPDGCTKLIVDVIGAAGGNGAEPRGGKGGRVQCNISVSSGQIINIYIGGKGGDAREGDASGGYNGGGSNVYACAAGGGGTDIRINGTDVSNRILVAGGGGGTAFASSGGAGGGLIGGSGGSNPYSGTAGGTGGTQNSGGIPGGSLFYGGLGGGGGYYGGGGGTETTGYFPGGPAGGSSYTDPILCTDVVHTQGYSEATGNGWLIITTSNE